MNTGRTALHDVRPPVAQRATQLLKLGTPHFAYLRAIAEGVAVPEAAARFLLTDTATQARAVHRLLIERARAVARRRGDSRWRLIGIEIARATPQSAPPIDEWARDQRLDDWSHAELQDLYAEAFGSPDASARRRFARNARLRERRLDLLRRLEATSSDIALPTDLLEGWLTPETAADLRRLGLLTLQDLQARVRRGGRWWTGLRAFGPTKARRLAEFVAQLLPRVPAGPSWSLALAQSAHERYSGAKGRNRAATTFAGTDAANDAQAIQRWVEARAKSPHTAAQYAREAERFLLWCVLERDKALSDASADDCRAYMEFLTDVPAAWITRRKVERHTPGWAPFRGALSLASQNFALTVLHSLFGWLVQARYLGSNPWVLVNRKLGDDPHRDLADPYSRAFTRRAWSALLDELASAGDIGDEEGALPAPGRASVRRLRWICHFVEGTGLRASELVAATVGDLRQLASGWVIQVHGKGRRSRIVPVPVRCMKETSDYLRSRGFEAWEGNEKVPLLGSLVEPRLGVTYAALHQTFTRFVRRAVKRLPAHEQRQAQRASTHWLRHTHATRSAEDNVPPDVLQENLGQSDPRTTARYYRAQIERRQREMERVFGHGVA